MGFFLSLQPIFSKKKDVYAYQLCHKKRNNVSDVNLYKVILDTIQAIGLDRFTREKPFFLSFSEHLIKESISDIIEPDKIIIDVKKPELVDEALIQSLDNLKQDNYTLCFGQYIFKSEYKGLLKFADIVKLNFSDIDVGKKQTVIDYCNRNNKNVLATKVDYNANFEFAKHLGCKFFEGAFFRSFEIAEDNEISPFKFNYLRLIGSVNRPTVNFEEIANIVSRDISLSYQLLRLVNSVVFGFVNKIESIKQAAVILGEKELKKWVAFLAMNAIVDDKPSEVARNALFRGKYAELLAKKTELKKNSDEIFMMGLFSMLDVIMGRPLKETLEGLQLANEIEKTLLERDGKYENLYSFVLAYENCDWNEVENKIQDIGLTESIVAEVYLEANTWCNELLEETFSSL